jgi:hypothetical protein
MLQQCSITQAPEEDSVVQIKCKKIVVHLLWKGVVFAKENHIAQIAVC